MDMGTWGEISALEDNGEKDERKERREEGESITELKEREK